jgi:ribosomal protein S18 acetylase RimI-like enzyme
MTINPTTNLIRLIQPHVQQAAVTLGKVFHNDPWMSCLYPDEVERRRRLPVLFEIALRYALRYGEITATADVTGMACWLPPGNTTPTLGRMLSTGALQRSLQLGLQGNIRSNKVQIYQNSLHKHHALEPHWYLWVLGVDTAVQGKGIGSTLLQSGLEQVDRAGLPAYLETMNPSNVPFYQKFGFSVVHEGDIPGSNIHMWSLLRTPR